MILNVSGIALSYQRIPSLEYFAQTMVAELADPPVLVEHPGQVIIDAVKDMVPYHLSGLSIIPTFSTPEYGFYLSQLEELFPDVHIISAASTRLFGLIHQVHQMLTMDPQRLVVVSETCPTGTAAAAFSAASQEGPKLVGVQFPDLEAINQIDFELAGYSGEIDPAGAGHLGSLIEARPGGRPVSLVSAGTFGQPKESLLNLVMLASAVSEKTLPFWNPSQHTQEMVGSIPGSRINTKARPWLGKHTRFQRSSVLIGKMEDSPGWHEIFINEIHQPREQITIRPIHAVDPAIFLIKAETPGKILADLETLETALSGRDSLQTLSKIAYTKYSTNRGPYTCVLLAATRDDLQKEITHAKTGLKESFRTGKHWTSPAGSYFTPSPLGKDKIAFVYPGAFNSYPGMARYLFYSFPGLQDAALRIIPDLSTSLAEELLFPADHSSIADLSHFPPQLIESGISLSVIFTMIFDQVFGLKPDAAFGYSLGETSMLWANHVWHDAHASSRTWNNSSLFKDGLVGEMNIVRASWSGQTLGEDFWGTYILKESLARVQEACQTEALVDRTIQNTSDEMVIAGERTACLRVIDKLGCKSLPMPLSAAIHHPAMSSSLETFKGLYSIPTAARDDIVFYTAANYAKLNLSQQGLSNSIAHMTCNPVDFPRLVNQVYDDGARIFLEVGPQKTCSRWIAKILQGKPHVVVPSNKRYQSDLAGFLKVAAILLSHGVVLKLDAIFPTTESPAPIPTQEREPTIAHLPQKSNLANQVPNNWDTRTALALTENLDRISADLAQSHAEFLAQQSNLTRALTRAFLSQGDIQMGNEETSRTDRNVLFSRDQIQAFTNGDHRLCFGDKFIGFGNRRFPRLPNGPLQLIDRVIHIDADPKIPRPGAALISEVDLTPQAWYRSGDLPVLPHVALMEIALQPCGFLSAYLGSLKGREDQDLYFRNLDGDAVLHFWPDQLGPVIANHVELISSSTLEDVIIQTYRFSLFQGEVPFFEGKSSFGYFPRSMMADQAGLDGKESASSWRELNPNLGSWKDFEPQHIPGLNGRNPRMPAVNRFWISHQGGIKNEGYLYLRQQIPENAWFYKAHFYQDPVMPGSLGVETMAQSLMSAAPAWNLPGDLSWRIKPGRQLSWKYRGQITPDTPQLSLDLHLQSAARTSAGWEICADGQLWKNGTRIYQVDNLCLESLTAG